MPYDITLLGASYEDVPAVVLPQTGGGTATFYGDLKEIVLRPDAELIQTYTHDSLLVTDDQVSIPAYTTTAKTVLAAANLSGTVTLDYTNYDYFVTEALLTTPVYNTTTIAKSRNEYAIGTACFEIIDIPANTHQARVNTTKYSSRSAVCNAYSGYRLLYWSSTTALGLYTSTSYGVHQVVSGPSISSGKLTVKAPSVNMRGSTSYLTSTVWGQITDIRRQFIIKVYRAPKAAISPEGWGLQQQYLKIAACANSTTGTLSL